MAAVDHFEYSAAHYAAVSGRTACLKVLLECRACLDTPDCEGRLPLHKAVRSSCLPVLTGCMPIPDDVGRAAGCRVVLCERDWR